MPDFVLIGAMKSATSTVSAFLEDHPAVYMVPRHEPNYFSHDENYAKGREWYESHFSNRTDELVCGEGSNYYSARSLYPEAARRMYRHNPDLRLIYVVRHPIDRIASAWIQNRADGGDEVPPTLDEAVRAMPERFIGQSRYWHNLEPYRDLFGDQNIFIGFMEDLKRDPETFFGSLCDFLGVSRLGATRPHLNMSAGKVIPTPAYTRVNRLPCVPIVKAVLPQALKTAVKDKILSGKVGGRPQFSEQTRTELVRILEPDSCKLLRHCGKSIEFWRF
jgi:hypothetical protein